MNVDAPSMDRAAAATADQASSLADQAGPLAELAVTIERQERCVGYAGSLQGEALPHTTECVHHPPPRCRSRHSPLLPFCMQVHGPQRLCLCVPRLCAHVLRAHLDVAHDARCRSTAWQPRIWLVLQVWAQQWQLGAG